MGDSDKGSKPSLDPLEGIGERAKEEADKVIEHQHEKVEKQKDGE
jgi:hypothetical protein